MVDATALLLLFLIPLGLPAVALIVLAKGSPRWRPVAAWCLAGFASGVAAAVAVSVIYAWMPGLKHSSPRMALPATLGFALMALVGLPVVGSVLGAVAGAFGAERRRGLGRGLALGLALGIGLIMLAPALRAGGEGFGADELAGLCFNGALSFPVLGAVVGAILSGWPKEEDAFAVGAACVNGALWGLGGGMLASLIVLASLLEARIGNGEVVSGGAMFPAQVVAGVYAVLGFTAAGAVLRAWPWLGTRTRWAWYAALGTFLLWGTVYRTVVGRPAFRASVAAPQGRIATDETMTIGADGRGDLLFHYAFEDRGRPNPVRCPIGKDAILFRRHDGPGPLGLMSEITWPAPGVFALTMDFVAGPRNRLKVGLEEGFDDVGATSDGVPVAVPVEVLPGERFVLVIKARCPAKATKRAPSGLIETPDPVGSPLGTPPAPAVRRAPRPGAPTPPSGYDGDLDMTPGPNTPEPRFAGRILIRPFTDEDRPPPGGNGVWLTGEQVIRVHGDRGLVLEKETRGEAWREGESGTVLRRWGFIEDHTATIAWPASGTFELTVDFDTDDKNRLTVRLAESFEDVTATLDGVPVAVPVKLLPPGKRHLVVKARSPATHAAGAGEGS